MNPIKISAVSYLNTKPFLLGLKKSNLINEVDLSLDIPSETARKLLTGEVNLGLVPVGIIPQLAANSYHIVSNYCIGTLGKVRTVCLYSQQPLSKIKTILLDHHSCTSVRLVKVLCEQYWQIQPKFIPAKKGFEATIFGNTAGVIIGDRTIEWEDKFAYVYDLGEAWKQFTGLPFVFAAWIATQKLPFDFEQKLNQAFQFGIQNIASVAQHFQSFYKSKFNVYHYLTNHIDYHLDNKKRQALQLFLKYLPSPIQIPIL